MPCEHPMDLVIIPLSEKPIGTSEDKSVIAKGPQDDLSVEVPYIDFIFGDQRWKPEDYDWMLKTQNLMHLMVPSHPS